MVLHIVAIAFYRIKKGQNLVTPMVRGDKQTLPGVPSARDDLGTRLLALLLFLLCGGAVAALLAWAA